MLTSPLDAATLPAATRPDACQASPESLTGATRRPRRRGCLTSTPGVSPNEQAFVPHRRLASSCLIVVDVPAMGFAWIDPAAARAASPAETLQATGLASAVARQRGAAAGRGERAAQRVLRNSFRSAHAAPFGRSPTTAAAIPGWPSRLPCGCPAAASRRRRPTTRSWRPTRSR